MAAWGLREASSFVCLQKSFGRTSKPLIRNRNVASLLFSSLGTAQLTKRETYM